jgi:hypothetical protein
MDSDQQNLPLYFKVHWLSWGKVLKRLYELQKEVGLFIANKKSGLSQFVQDKKWVSRLAYLSDIFSYINELNLKLQGPDTTFNGSNKIESPKKELKLWLNMIAKGNNEMFQSCSDYITAHLKMLLFEKYYSEHENSKQTPGKICGL